MEAFNTMIVEQDGPLLWITLHRPEAMNAYTDEMGCELARAFKMADTLDDIRVVILTAKGKVFCAGADVSAGAGAFDTESGDGAKNFGGRSKDRDNNFISAILNCCKPSIVAFNGSAAGVGLTLTLPCDIRIATEKAKFGFVFARRGLVPEAGSAWFLPQIVGLPQALRWCMTGALFPASEALEKGLITEVVETEKLTDRARELAMEIANNCSPVALALTKRMLWRFGSDPNASGALGVDAALNIEMGKKADVHEGVAAFLEKRTPDFPLNVSTDMPDTSSWWDAKQQSYRR